MALINRPMYEHFGARHLGVKGPGALTNLEEGVMGVLPLDMSADPAYWYIQGIRVYSQSIFQAAVSSQYAACGLSIENTSDQWLTKIICIDFTTSSQYGNGTYDINRCARTAFSSDPGVYAYSTDTRISESQPSQTIMLNGNHAVNPGVELQKVDTRGDPDRLHWSEMPMIVSPGQCIYVASRDLNTAFRVGFMWAEIPAYKAEL
jgi:hypothetical protein